jgi:hypothetical protein
MAEALGLLKLRSCLPITDDHPIHRPHPFGAEANLVEVGTLGYSEVPKNEARKRCANSPIALCSDIGPLLLP